MCSERECGRALCGWCVVGGSQPSHDSRTQGAELRRAGGFGGFVSRRVLTGGGRGLVAIPPEAAFLGTPEPLSRVCGGGTVLNIRGV